MMIFQTHWGLQVGQLLRQVRCLDDSPKKNRLEALLTPTFSQHRSGRAPGDTPVAHGAAAGLGWYHGNIWEYMGIYGNHGSSQKYPYLLHLCHLWLGDHIFEYHNLGYGATTTDCMIFIS